MLLKDYKDWKKKMQTQPGTADSNVNTIAPQRDAKVEIVIERGHVIFVELPDGQSGLFYAANVLVDIKTYMTEKLEEQTVQKNYWRSRCEDIETAYNLQKSSLEHVDRDMKEKNERIQILSEALTRSKMQERGKKIYISRLQNQLAKNSNRRK